MARRLQNAYIQYKFAQRAKLAEARHKLTQHRAASLELDDEIATPELKYMLQSESYDIEDSHKSERDRQSIDEEKSEGNGDQSPSQRPGLTHSQTQSKNVLDHPWVPPSLKKAHHYANSVQPRRGGKNGTPFEFFSTTTGRHCFLGGFGEQFDLWEEGQISEFSLFGPGVTNYFKFMKWGFWLFVVITVISLPAIALNMNGHYTNDNAGLTTIGRTTVGNLASTTANTTILIPIPGCSSSAFDHIECVFTGEDLAMFYSSIDIVISTVILIAFIWLLVFEKVEQNMLNESTGKSIYISLSSLYTCTNPLYLYIVTASMFSISVTNLPKDVTDIDLRAHFNTLVGKTMESVVNVSIAYDNAEEIKAFRKRGDLLRAKLMLVQVCNITLQWSLCM